MEYKKNPTLTIDLECKTNIKLDYNQALKEAEKFDSEDNPIVNIFAINILHLCSMLELDCELRFKDNSNNTEPIISRDTVASTVFFIKILKKTIDKSLKIWNNPLKFKNKGIDYV